LWQLYVGRALEAVKILIFGVERSKNAHGERISNKKFDQILQRNSGMYLAYYRGKFGGCWQIPTQKNVSGSKLCRHDRGIWTKCADIWLSWQHVADMSATFSAKNLNTIESIDEA
jgi:hypothetical protein